MTHSAEYVALVGQQAVTLEERMRMAGVQFQATGQSDGWRVTLGVPGGMAYSAKAKTLSAALWAAASACGFTEGLAPP